MRSPVLFTLAVFLGGPAPAADPPTVEALVEKLADQRKQRAELEKAERETAKLIAERLEAIRKRLDELNVPAPVPPGPGPKPPAPPPADPLAAAVKAAYDADPDPGKAGQVKDLAELYKQAAELAADPRVTTTGQLVERVKAAALVLKITGLTGVRKVVAGEVSAVMPDDVPLTPAARTAAATVFTRVHAALKGVS